MAGNTANPRVWTGAQALAAPVGTTGPTDLATVLNTAFKDVGLLSEDGLTEAREQDTTDFFAYGGILIRTIRSKHKRTIKVICLEDNLVVWGLVNPGSTAATTGGVTTRTVKVPIPNPQAFVLVLTDGDVTLRRAIPKGEVVEVGEVKAADTEMTMYELTINIYPSAAGVLYLDITNDPQAAVV